MSKILNNVIPLNIYSVRFMMLISRLKTQKFTIWIRQTWYEFNITNKICDFRINSTVSIYDLRLTQSEKVVL